MKNSIIPSLWFDSQAQEAFEFYAQTFPNSQINAVNPIVVEANIMGLDFIGINGGPTFKPNPSISSMLVFESKDELQAVWEKLSPSGKIMMPLNSYPFSELYGWVEDKYGISWQLYHGKLEQVNQQAVIPTLMFCGANQGKCKDALAFYARLFKNYEAQGVMEYPEGEVKGQVMHAQFKANEVTMAAMDSGVPMDFTFNEGVSLTITCKDQEELDYYWDSITAEGEESQCGWCKDAFGVSWQVVPQDIAKLLAQNPKAGSALMGMKKISIAGLENA